MTKEERAGISLGARAFWRVSGVKDPERFFSALRALVPKGSVLALQGPRGRDVQTFLCDNPASTRTKVELGTIWPRIETYHVDCTDRNLRRLEELAGHHAQPEIAMHTHVYRDEQVLIEWYDAFDDPLEMSREFSAEDVARFCEECGGSYERIES